MKLLRLANGATVAFGFNMDHRLPDATIICWSDPEGGWEPTVDNQAGSYRFNQAGQPEFVRETETGFIAYQPGLCIEATYVGLPMVYQFRLMKSDG